MNLVGRKHPALHRRATDIADIDGRVVALADRMVAACRRHRGLALAAPQVGLDMRLVVTADGDVLINPEIRDVTGRTAVGLEACLSLPGRVYEIERATRVLVAATSIDGAELEPVVVTGLTARMWQHEIDHLDGTLISDRGPEVRNVDWEDRCQLIS